MQRAAIAADITLDQAFYNIIDYFNHRSSLAQGLVLPDFSIDIDGTIAFDTQAYLAIINNALGEHYSYADVSMYHDYSWTSNPQKAHDAVKAFVHSDEFGWTIAPDYAAIAAVQALYNAGFHIIVATLRNPKHEDATRAWLSQWQVPFHELRMGKLSKQSVADDHDVDNPVIFVDDCGDFQSLVKPGVELALLRRPYTDSFGTLRDGVTVYETWIDILRSVHITNTPTVQQLDEPINTAHVAMCETVTKQSKIKAAGICVIAKDTGRILMLQRDFDDPNSKQAAGRWEFPGGKLDDGESPYDAALREWQEETGNALPQGELVDNWISDTGVYQGFVYVIPHESSISLNPDKDERAVDDPDHPSVHQGEVVAWWRFKDAKHAGQSLREEFDDFDWKIIKRNIPKQLRKMATKAAGIAVKIAPRKDTKMDTIRAAMVGAIIGSNATNTDALQQGYSDAYWAGASLFDLNEDDDGDEDDNDAIQKHSDKASDYLQTFAAAIATGNLSDDQIQARADMYGNSLDGAYFDGAMTGAQSAGVRTLTWVYGFSKEGCGLCSARDGEQVDYDGGDPTWSDGFTGLPGDGDLGDGCEGFCQCEVDAG